jgi:hypothetical protein
MTRVRPRTSLSSVLAVLGAVASCSGPSSNAHDGVDSGVGSTHTWSDVNIPSWVSGNTAYVGFTAGCNTDCPGPLYINSFTYATGTP